MPSKSGPGTKHLEREHYVDELFYSLDEGDKLAIIRAASITDERPNFLRGRGGDRSALSKWMKPIRHRIVPLLFRLIDFSDYAIGRLVSDGDLSLDNSSQARQVNLRFDSSRVAEGAQAQPLESSMVQLSDLTGSSAVLFEMFVSICAANRPLGLQDTFIPPGVRVEGGSVKFSLGGGMVTSGIGLIVACGAGLLPPSGLVIGGSLALASIGILDLVVGWKQKLAETRKTDEETRVSKAEHGPIDLRQNRRFRGLELKIKEMELEKARTLAEGESLEDSRFAYSSLVPREVVIAEAKRWGWTEEYANHILNRALPTYLALRPYIGQVEIQEEPPATEFTLTGKRQIRLKRP
jgi:hypothetical protein